MLDADELLEFRRVLVRAGSEQGDAMERDEIEPYARLLLDIGLLRRARGPTVRHAHARIGEKQGLLRQLVLVLDANLEIADMLRLAGERRAVAEDVSGGNNAAIGANDIVTSADGDHIRREQRRERGGMYG